MLAGVSPDYYARLEQGRAANVSGQVVNAVATALRLDDLERRHLAALARPADPAPSPPLAVRRELRTMVASLDPVPAMLHGPRFEVLAVNRMARALIHDFDAMPVGERNLVRWVFTDPRARRVYVDWADVAAQLVAVLRTVAGRNGGDARLDTMVDELSALSPDFAAMWADHRVRRHGHGPKRFFHDAVGALTVNFETMYLEDDSGIALTVYTADPDSPAAERLTALARHAGVG